MRSKFLVGPCVKVCLDGFKELRDGGVEGGDGDGGFAFFTWDIAAGGGNVVAGNFAWTNLD